jgi:hypothetical protein
MTRRISPLPLLLLLSLTTPLLSNCSEGDEITIPGQPAEESTVTEYTLTVNDTVSEVRRSCATDSEAPWTAGLTATRCESRLLTTEDGFVFPDAFLQHWSDELTRVLVEYELAGEDEYALLGWDLYASRDTSQPAAAHIHFTEPVVFIPARGDRSETTTRASIMKRDTTSLFDPRGDQAGRPELEGEGTATLVCENILRGPDTVRSDYELRIEGEGVMRYFQPSGDDWLLTGDETHIQGDREEACTFLVKRKGVKEFSRGPDRRWVLSEDLFHETWYAESTETGALIRESTASGPDAACHFTRTELPRRTNEESPTFNVRDYGAAGDDATLDTHAINAAIDACSAHGRGTVRLPPGVYLTGSVHMKSNVSLKLEAGAILRATTDMTQYDPREENPWSEYQDGSHSYFHRSLIWGEDLQNVAILGPGLIDGNDVFEPWPGRSSPPQPPFGWILSTLLYQIDEDLFRRGPKPIALKSCTNVLIKDITIQHAPDEAILATGCRCVLVHGFTAREVRVDGIDPDGCESMTIADSEIRSLDDAVAIKSGYALGRKLPCRDLTVRNCLVSSFVNALKIGTESVGDFRNILFRDCVIDNLPGFPSYGGISVISVDGGEINGLAATGITMRNVNYPVFIRLGDRLRTPENPPIGRIRNVLIEKVSATGGIGTGASLIIAVPEATIGEGIHLEDVEITCLGGGSLLSSFLPVPEARESSGVYPDPAYILPGKPPAYGFFCRHATDLAFRNVRLGFEIPDRRAALIAEDVAGLVIEGLDAQSAPRSAPSIIVR